MSGKKIVVVDDDEDLLRLITALFKAKGFEVISFKTGHEAQNFFQNETNVKSTSLLILDRLLPDMEGLEILLFLQEKHPRAFPVLVLSSLSAEKDVLEGLQKGAIDYVSKPFSTKILMQKAEKLLSS